MITFGRLSGKFPADFRDKRMLHGVERMVGQCPSRDMDVGKMELALRIFPLNAEAVSLANSLFRKQESKRSQEKKPIQGGASLDRGVVKERDVNDAVEGYAAELCLAVMQDKEFMGRQADDRPVVRDSIQQILQTRNTSPVSMLNVYLSAITTMRIATMTSVHSPIGMGSSAIPIAAPHVTPTMTAAWTIPSMVIAPMTAAPMIVQIAVGDARRFPGMTTPPVIAVTTPPIMGDCSMPRGITTIISPAPIIVF